MESWVPSMWWGIFHETRDLPEALVQGKELLYLTWFFKNLAFPAAVYLETSSKVLPSEIFLLFLSPFLSSMSNPNGLISMKKSQLAYIPSVVTPDINEFVSHYSAPGVMRAGFEYYRAVPQDAIENQNYSKTKLTMPVLV